MRIPYQMLLMLIKRVLVKFIASNFHRKKNIMKHQNNIKKYVGIKTKQQISKRWLKEKNTENFPKFNTSTLCTLARMYQGVKNGIRKLCIL